MSETRKVWVVMGADGTCPSDSMDWLVAVYATKADADADAEAMTAEQQGPGPWYSVEERELLISRQFVPPTPSTP